VGGPGHRRYRLSDAVVGVCVRRSAEHCGAPNVRRITGAVLALIDGEELKRATRPIGPPFSLVGEGGCGEITFAALKALIRASKTLFLIEVR